MEKCAEITNGSISENELDLSFKSFEFVVYTKCDSDESLENQTFDIKHTTHSSTDTNENIRSTDKQGTFLTSIKKDKIMSIIMNEENNTNSSAVKDCKSQSVLTQITEFQEKHNLRFGIIDGLHRLTAFNTILRKKKGSSIFHNMNCQCNIYIMKEKEEVKYNCLQPLFLARSLLISQNQSKSIAHTLHDNIMEIIRTIDKTGGACYLNSIKEYSLKAFMADINDKNRNDGFCSDFYFDIFRDAHEKLLRDCNLYEQAFRSHIINAKRKENRHMPLFEDEEKLKKVFKPVLTNKLNEKIIHGILHKEPPKHRLRKEYKFNISCACVHRLLSSYMSFDRPDEMKHRLNTFEKVGLTNLHDITLTVAYADILASDLIDTLKKYKKSRLVFGYYQFHRILSNYFITTLMDGIHTLHQMGDDIKTQIFEKWGMTNELKSKDGEDDEDTNNNNEPIASTPINKCCQKKIKGPKIVIIDWTGNKYMTLMGIYCNYAKHIMKQELLAISNKGFTTVMKMKKDEVTPCTNDFFTLEGELQFELNEVTRPMQTNNGLNKEHVPVLFENFVKKIQSSIINEEIRIYADKGNWQIYEPEKIGERYKKWTDTSTTNNTADNKKKEKKVLTAETKKQNRTLKLNKNDVETVFQSYEEWDEAQEQLNERERHKIAIRIVDEFKSNKQFNDHVTSILQGEMDKNDVVRSDKERDSSDSSNDEYDGGEEEGDDNDDDSNNNDDEGDTDDGDELVTRPKRKPPDQDPAAKSPVRKSPRLANEKLVATSNKGLATVTLKNNT